MRSCSTCICCSPIVSLVLVLGLSGCGDVAQPDFGSLHLAVGTNISVITTFRVEIMELATGYASVTSQDISATNGTGSGTFSFLPEGSYVGSVQAYIFTSPVGLPMEFVFDIVAGQTTYLTLDLDVRQGTSTGGIGVGVTAYNGAEVTTASITETQPVADLTQTHAITGTTGNAQRSMGYISWDKDDTNPNHTQQNSFVPISNGYPLELTYAYSALSVVNTYACAYDDTKMSGQCVEYIEDATTGTITEDWNYWMRDFTTISDIATNPDTMVLTNGSTTKVLYDRNRDEATIDLATASATGLAVSWGFDEAGNYVVRVRDNDATPSTVTTITISDTGAAIDAVVAAGL